MQENADTDDVDISLTVQHPKKRTRKQIEKEEMEDNEIKKKIEEENPIQQLSTQSQQNPIQQLSTQSQQNPIQQLSTQSQQNPIQQL
ncbi:MAG: hypothetical protein EZS28_029081, partial [Streblomastix strix]